jgi:Fur family ferric uptake transcriptional regulator
MTSTYHDLLHAHRLSNTKQRQQIFDSIVQLSKPVSMLELITLNDTIDRVSVYRIVEAFEKAGILSRLQIGWKYKIELSDAFKQHHHHMTCLKCGSIIEFDEPESLDSELTDISRKHGFTVTQHTLEIRGICRHCQK